MLRFLCVLLAASALGSLAVCYSTTSVEEAVIFDNPGDLLMRYRNVYVRVRIEAGQASGQDSNRIVSGTKCEFGVTLSMWFQTSADTPQYVPPSRTVGHVWRTIKVSAYDSVTVTGEPVAMPAVTADATAVSNTVRYASTHFVDNSPVNMRLKGKFYFMWGVAQPGEPIEPVEQIEKSWECKKLIDTTYNKASILGYWGQATESDKLEGSTDERKHGALTSKGLLEAMNHSITYYDRSPNWFLENAKAAILPCTAFYVNSHGGNFPLFQNNIGGSGDDSTDPGPVLEQRQLAGTLHYPPVNLAYLDACQTAVTSTGGENHGFSLSFLYPLPEAGSEGIDRAEVGWRTAEDSIHTNTCCQAFWFSISAGKTANEARNDAIVAVNLEFGTAYTPTNEVAVFGDYFTRLNSVYTGLNAGALNWYLVF